MGRVLAIVHRAIATHLIRKEGVTHKTACTGAAAQVRRCGSALNLNIHFKQRGSDQSRWRGAYKNRSKLAGP